jgi:N-acyl-L-homoserine lactone synthetase
MQRVDVAKLCQIQRAEVSLEKLSAGPRIAVFSNDSRHPELQTLKQMQFGCAITDIHDAFSVHFAALEEGGVFGGARLVMPNAQLGLPSMSVVMKTVGVDEIKQAQYAEITHFVSKQEARRRHSDTVDGASKSLRQHETMGSHLLTKNQVFILRLLKALFDYAKAQDILYIVFSMTSPMEQMLRTMRFTFEKIETVSNEHDAGTNVCVFNLPDLEMNLLNAGHMIGQWFVRPNILSFSNNNINATFDQSSRFLKR